MRTATPIGAYAVPQPFFWEWGFVQKKAALQKTAVEKYIKRGGLGLYYKALILQQF